MGGGARRRDSAMLITGFNLSSTDYARIRRTRMWLAGVATVLFMVLAAQLVTWAVIHRREDGNGARLEAMRAEVRQHESALQAV